jgi:hypothetical protein
MDELITSSSLDKDLNSNVKKSDKYSFALNAVIEGFSEENSFPFLSSATSNFLSSFLPVGEKLISYKYVNEFNIVILFTILDNKSYIKYFKVDKGFDLKFILEVKPLKDIVQSEITTIYTIAESDCLNFQEDQILNSIYKITETTLNLYFVDNYNSDRFLYLDYSSDKTLSLNNEFKNFTRDDACNITYEDTLNCNSIKWNPNLNYPNLSLDIISGGEKDKAVYSYLIAYSTAKGLPLSEYKSLTSPIHIYSEKKDSNNAIEILVSNITEDTRFNYYSIVCIKTKNNQTSYYRVGTYPINQKKVIDSDKSELDISFSEIFKTLIYYKSSKFIKDQNNIVFRASLKEYNRFNLQKLVNKVKLNWIKVKLKEGDYKKSKIANQYRSYLSDENYIFGIKFILDNLEETPVFVIPGRDKELTDSILINNDDTNNENIETWKVYNTAAILNTNDNVDYNNENPNIIQEGTFGYNESSEKYPNIPEVWGDLCNKPINTHKFPDIKISNFHSTSDNFKDNVYIYPLGVKLSDNIDLQILLKEAVTDDLITEEQRLRIKGYKLVRGNRVGNKSIIAKGLLYNIWNYTEKTDDCGDGNKYFFPSYPFNDTSNDELISSTKDHYDYEKFELNSISTSPIQYENTNRYSFLSPDTTFVEPSLGNELKIESEEFGKAEGFFNNSEGQAKQLMLTKKHYNIAIVLAKWIGQSIKNPDVEAAAGTAAGIGNSIGGSVGSAVGLEGIGSALGGIVGGLVGTNMAEGDLNHLIFQNSVIIAEAEKILQLFQLSNKPKSLHKQYQAVGKYSNTQSIDNNGNKVRKILTSGYLKPDYISIQEEDEVINFNNWNREKSVYLKINKNLPILAKDNSRIKLNTSVSETPIYSEECFNWNISTSSAQDNRFKLKGIDCRGEGFFIKEFKNDNYNETICAQEILVDEADGIFGIDVKVKLGDLSIVKGSSCGTPEIIGYEKESCNCETEKRISDVSSYYASIKNNIINQYGNIYDVNWIETHSDMKPLHKCLEAVIKPVNLISVKLNTQKLTPSKLEVITNIDCIEVADPCSLSVSWAEESTFIKTCRPDGKTQFTIGVVGNQGQIVQFSENNTDWFDANIGTNQYTYVNNPGTNCNSIWFKVKGCSSSSWGCMTPFSKLECVPAEIITPPNPDNLSSIQYGIIFPIDNNGKTYGASGTLVSDIQQSGEFGQVIVDTTWGQLNSYYDSTAYGARDEAWSINGGEWQTTPLSFTVPDELKGTVVTIVKGYQFMSAAGGLGVPTGVVNEGGAPRMTIKTIIRIGR